MAEPEDIKAFAESVPKLAGAGMRIGVAWAHDKLGIPVADDTEAVLQSDTAAAPPPVDGAPSPAPGPTPAPTPAPSPTPQPEPGKPAKPAALSAVPGAAPRDALDDLVDEAAGQWEPVLAPLVQPVLAALDEAIARGDSIESFRQSLPGLFAGMNPDPLANQVAKATFVAGLSGAADLDLDGAIGH